VIPICDTLDEIKRTELVLFLDCVQGAADSIGMYLGGNVERLEAPLDVLKGSHLMKSTNQEAPTRLETTIFENFGSRMVAENEKGVTVISVTP